jgi:hypothetical protein
MINRQVGNNNRDGQTRWVATDIKQRPSRTLLEELANPLLAFWANTGQDRLGVQVGRRNQLLSRLGNPGSGLALQSAGIEGLHNEAEDAVSLGKDSGILPTGMLV